MPTNGRPYKMLLANEQILKYIKLIRERFRTNSDAQAMRIAIEEMGERIERQNRETVSKEKDSKESEVVKENTDASR